MQAYPVHQRRDIGASQEHLPLRQHAHGGRLQAKDAGHCLESHVVVGAHGWEDQLLLPVILAELHRLSVSSLLEMHGANAREGGKHVVELDASGLVGILLLVFLLLLAIDTLLLHK